MSVTVQHDYLACRLDLNARLVELDIPCIPKSHQEQHEEIGSWQVWQSGAIH